MICVAVVAIVVYGAVGILHGCGADVVPAEYDAVVSLAPDAVVLLLLLFILAELLILKLLTYLNTLYV